MPHCWKSHALAHYLLCSYVGTTLTQEMTYLIATGDYERATTVQLDARFPLIEHLDDRYPYYGGLKMVQKLPRPRTVKSHLHHFLLPEQLRQGKGKVGGSTLAVDDVSPFQINGIFA